MKIANFFSCEKRAEDVAEDERRDNSVLARHKRQLHEVRNKREASLKRLDFNLAKVIGELHRG